MPGSHPSPIKSKCLGVEPGTKIFKKGSPDDSNSQPGLKTITVLSTWVLPSLTDGKNHQGNLLKLPLPGSLSRPPCQRGSKGLEAVSLTDTLGDSSEQAWDTLVTWPV